MIRICFMGLGSIGTRHLYNLTAILYERGEAFIIDALRSGNRPLPDSVAALLHREYFDAAQLPDDYHMAFICNPTSMHADSIRTFANKARHLFIEKPVFDATDIRPDTLGLGNGVYYVAAPLRYTSVLQYIKEATANRHVYSARAICSTYLPDWRAGVDYRTVYSARKAEGGGVSIDLIHEWDYLCWLFGMPEQVENLQGRYSALEIDSDDISIYIAKYRDKLISLHLDYFGRAERREVELYLEDEVIVGDIRRGEVRFLKKGRTLPLTEERDEYQRRELLHFLSMVENGVQNDNTIAHALEVLRIAKGEYHA